MISIDGLKLPDTKKIVLGIVRDADNALTRGVIMKRSGLPDKAVEQIISSLIDEGKLTCFPGEAKGMSAKTRYLTVAENKDSIESEVSLHLWELSAAGQLYFAYGSDLNPEEMYTIRCPGSSFLCKGYIEGFELSFDQYQEEWEGTVPSIKFTGGGSQVWGALYCIAGEYWKKLDSYEDVPRLNRRVKVPVRTAYGIYSAGCYQSLPGDKKLPSGKYLEKVLAGLEFFGLPQKYVRYIKALPVNKKIGQD